jgi:hypothetical protein
MRQVLPMQPDATKSPDWEKAAEKKTMNLDTH